MLVAQLLPFVKNLATRKWSDEDILEDVQFLRDELEARFESLTYVPFFLHKWRVGDKRSENRTWDEYTSELTSGHLSWTPVHDSDLFWKENVTKLNEKDHFYLKFVFPRLERSRNGK
jgi:V-type H+-transporting ATPase subunit H